MEEEQKKEHPLKKELMSGKMIEPLELDGNESIKDFVNNVFGDSGYNARNLAEACTLFKKMIDEGTTTCLTLAGAMTPIGFSGLIIKMIELGFIDMIISTGANLYHDMHRAFNCPMRQGEVNVDDEALNKVGVARIYDVFIEDGETMLPTDDTIIMGVLGKKFGKPLSTAQLHYILGKEIEKRASHPEKSLLVAAAKYNVPVYTSSPGDSSLAMNLILPHFYSHEIPIDPLKDVVETTAFVYNSAKNSAIIVGGGSPKNFYLQTQPTLWQMLDLEKGGHDYFIQLTTDSPQWGGLSGATPQEAKSWGKVKPGEKNNIVVYSCASITFPVMCQFAKMSCKPRKHKELMLKRNEYAKKMLKDASMRKKLIEDSKTIGLIIKDNYSKYFED